MRSQQNSCKESEWVANFVELGYDETVSVSFASCKFIILDCLGICQVKNNEILGIGACMYFRCATPSLSWHLSSKIIRFKGLDHMCILGIRCATSLSILAFVK